MIKLYELDIETQCKYGKDVTSDYRELARICKNTIKDYDEDLIKRSFYYLVDKFKDINRSSGDPYYTHPLKVAILTIEKIGFADNVTTSAALLHDILEDIKTVHYEDLLNEFGKEVADMVEALTKIKGSKTRNLDKAATNLKLFSALIQDLRVILIKLADRYDNLTSLHHLSEKKQKKIGEETLNFYIPFSQRLGLIKIKRNMEDLALLYIDREKYFEIRSALKEKRFNYMYYIEDLLTNISNKLAEKNVDGVVTIEHKHIYEVFKMIQQGKNINDIDNFYSIVITLNTDDFTEAYKTYGIIANVFGHVYSMEDYIARPKINYYKALHSTHFGPENKIVEVIIRTDEMDSIAQNGIAALHRINSDYLSLEFDESGTNEWLQWMEDITSDNDDDSLYKIWGSIKMNLYEEQINVHTTDNMTYRLPKHSCPIDLAFAIGEETGYHCISAKVNGEVQELNYELKDNDKVEIITSQNSMPSYDWNNIVITHTAVTKLYYYFKKNSNIIFTKQLNQLPPDFIQVKVTGEDRANLVNDLIDAIGRERVIRLYLNPGGNFEALISFHSNEKPNLNKIIAKILVVKSINGAFRIQE